MDGYLVFRGPAADQHPALVGQLSAPSYCADC
jgi:hypothetical protein